MNNESVAPESVSAGAAPNLLQRVILVFTAPGKLGEALRRRWPWLWALAIVVVVGTLIVLITPEELLRQAAEAQVRGRPEGQPLPSTATMRAIGAGAAFAGGFVVAAVIGGILYLVFSVFFGQSELTYKQHLSALSHAWWILMVGSLVVFALQVAKGDATLRLGLGLLLAEEPSSFPGHFIANITIFGLWSSAALGLVESGLSGRKVTAGKAAGTIVVLYLLFAAIVAGFSSLTGQ
jgi:hypothetical protein